MSLPVNVAIREPLYLGTSGETLTRAYSEIGGTAVTFTPSMTDQGDGTYLMSYTPTVTGRHIWIGATSSGIPVMFDWQVSVADPGNPDTLAAAVIAALPARQVVTIASPVATDGTATVTQGDDATLTFTNSGWSIASGHGIELVVTYAGVSTVFPGTRVSATSVSVSLTEDDTANLTPGRLHYTYLVRDTTDDLTLATGLMTVRAS
jgi:hypothetical protein